MSIEREADRLIRSSLARIFGLYAVMKLIKDALQ